MPDLTRTSKHLSYVLRHRPESIGVVLDGAGWVDIDVLLEALRDHGRTVTRAELDRVVAAPTSAGSRSAAAGSGPRRATRSTSIWS
jgi:putative RNA 2'-phosphotransferase